MVDFISLLPPEQREPLRRRIRAEAREAERLHGLPDRWLANEVLRIARTVRATTPHDRERQSYNGLLLWDVMPEIARRLGATLQPNESLDYEVKTCGPDRLREIAASCYQNASRHHMSAAEDRGADLCPVSFLTREAANGNPVAIALDRACPPGPEARDHLATHVASIARIRGHAEVAAWHPGLQGKPVDPPEPEEEPSFGPAP